MIYVLGNHEYYEGKYPRTMQKMKQEAAGSHVHVLENDVITINGVNFLGCTLWTDFSILGDPRISGQYCSDRMNDYRKIRRVRQEHGRTTYSKLRSIDTAVIHKKSRDWLERELKEKFDENNVVVTHHAPSGRSLDRIHSPDIAFPNAHDVDLTSAAYASNLESLMYEYMPNLWIHGHTHIAREYYVAGTKVVCNPAGYAHEHIEGFATEKCIEVDLWASSDQ